MGGGDVTLYEWANKWGIPQVAIDDLVIDTRTDNITNPEGATSEQGVSKRVRVEAASAGKVLWRNNNGACQDTNGNFIRYGLCNESKAMNASVKSSDLIGITPLVVTPELVGRTVGIFTAREVKAPGWQFKGTPREVAQEKFGSIVQRYGGDFSFIT